MPLFNVDYSAVPAQFNVHAVDAGDADEMVTRLQNAFQAAAAAGETQITDLKLAGTGSGPQWQAWFLVAAGAIIVATADAEVVAAVAGNPEEAVFYLKERLADRVGDTLTTVYKIEVAGAGDGRSYMAVALFGPTPPA